MPDPLGEPYHATTFLHHGNKTTEKETEKVDVGVVYISQILQNVRVKRALKSSFNFSCHLYGYRGQLMVSKPNSMRVQNLSFKPKIAYHASADKNCGKQAKFHHSSQHGQNQDDNQRNYRDGSGVALICAIGFFVVSRTNQHD